LTCSSGVPAADKVSMTATSTVTGDTTEEAGVIICTHAPDIGRLAEAIPLPIRHT
jgi:hypothetical protein